MRLVTYRDRDRSIKPGVLLGEEVIDISDQVADVRNLIEEGPDALGKLRNFLKGETCTRILRPVSWAATPTASHPRRSAKCARIWFAMSPGAIAG
jgi:hypothetical protein